MLFLLVFSFLLCMYVFLIRDDDLECEIDVYLLQNNMAFKKTGIGKFNRRRRKSGQDPNFHNFRAWERVILNSPRRVNGRLASRRLSPSNTLGPERVPLQSTWTAFKQDMIPNGSKLMDPTCGGLM